MQSTSQIATPSGVIINHIDDEDKKIVDLNSLSNKQAITGAVSKGWIKNEDTVINESGLYSSILSNNYGGCKTR